MLANVSKREVQISISFLRGIYGVYLRIRVSIPDRLMVEITVPPVSYVGINL